MSYIADQLDPAPIIVKGDVITPFIIVTITITIFLVFWIYIITTITRSVTNPVGASAVNTGKLLLACNPGECGTNMISGEKRCPLSNVDVVLIDPGSEVCNPKFRCTAFQTPYALKANGATNELGVCDAGTTCRCLKYPQCATHVASIFTTVNGTLYNESQDNRFTFVQVPSRKDAGVSSVNYQSAGSNFCGIKASNLNRITGACSFTDEDYQNAKGTLKIVMDCINTNPCIVGTMAFDSSNPNDLLVNGVGLDEVRNIPVTCVNKKPLDTNGVAYPSGRCPDGYVPIYDQRSDDIRCAIVNLIQYTV